MVRLGMSIEEIALVFGIVKQKLPATKQLEAIDATLREHFGVKENFPRTEIAEITSEGLLQAQLYARKYP